MLKSFVRAGLWSLIVVFALANLVNAQSSKPASEKQSNEKQSDQAERATEAVNVLTEIMNVAASPGIIAVSIHFDSSFRTRGEGGTGEDIGTVCHQRKESHVPRIIDPFPFQTIDFLDRQTRARVETCVSFIHDERFADLTKITLTLDEPGLGLSLR